MIKVGDEVTFLYTDEAYSRRRRAEGRVTEIVGDSVTIDVYPAPNSTLEEIRTSIVEAHVQLLDG